MIFNAKGWAGLGIIAIISGALSYTIYRHPVEVVYQNTDTPTSHDSQIVIGTSTLNVRVARTNEEVTKGLSGTLSMNENEGMIFLFSVSDRYRFWMPDMHFGLDMIWIDESMKIVDISKNVPPLLDISKPIYYEPKTPARYVLEVHAGWSERNNISIGESVRFKGI